MRDDQARFLLHRAAADPGPALRLDVTDLVRRGRRARAVRRRLVVAGSSLATAATAALIALLLVHRPTQPDKVQPAHSTPPPLTSTDQYPPRPTTTTFNYFPGVTTTTSDTPGTT